MTNGTIWADNSSTSFEDLMSITVPVETARKSNMDYEIFWTGVWIYNNSWKFVVPLGLVGNLIIVIVTIKMKPVSSTSLFILSLAAVDLAICCVRIPFRTIPKTTTTICRIMWYLYNAIPLLSNYILLFWTIERFIAVQFPLRVTEWFTIKRTAISIAFAGICSFALNVVWPVSIILKARGRGCGLYADKMEFIFHIWYKVDTSIFVLIPMIIIFLCNFLIIYRLQQSTKRHKQMTSNEKSRQKRTKEHRNTTITLLTVSLAFLVLHAPIAVYNCIAMSPIVITDPKTAAEFAFFNSLALALAELQNSVNCYLYFLTGRRYRRSTFDIFIPCRRTLTFKSKGLDSAMNMTESRASPMLTDIQ